MYTYNGTMTIEQELAAAAEAKEAARERIQERRAQLRKLRNDRKQLRELVEYENHLEAEIHRLTVAEATPLPEPVYGGRRGLEAAADEMKRYNRTRNSRTRPALAA